MPARIFLAVVFFTLTFPAFAGDKDSLLSASTFRYSLLQQWPYEHHNRPLLPEYKIRRKLRVANGLVIGGSACVIAAMPLLVNYLTYADRHRNAATRDNGGEFLLGFGAVACAVAGIGLIIPGSILHHKYKWQLERVR